MMSFHDYFLKPITGAACMWMSQILNERTRAQGTNTTHNIMLCNLPPLVHSKPMVYIETGAQHSKLQSLVCSLDTNQCSLLQPDLHWRLSGRYVAVVSKEGSGGMPEGGYVDSVLIGYDLWQGVDFTLSPFNFPVLPQSTLNIWDHPQINFSNNPLAWCSTGACENRSLLAPTKTDLRRNTAHQNTYLTYSFLLAKTTSLQRPISG